MKVNPLGVNAYQQMTGQSRVTRRPDMAENKTAAVQTGKISIPGQGENSGSKLSVKLSGGNFMEMLAPEERQALELLFNKYESGQLAGGTRQGQSSSLGNFVDVKL